LCPDFWYRLFQKTIVLGKNKYLYCKCQVCTEGELAWRSASVLAIRVTSGSDPAADCYLGHQVIWVSSCDLVSNLYIIRPQGIMLQIFIIILFRISSKILSLCSLLFPKPTDYSHYSQLCCHTFTAFLHFCNQNVQQYLVVAYTI